MRAQVLEKPRAAEQAPLRLNEVADPQPGAGEVRLQVHYCGLCHTDLHTVEGDLPLPRLPLIPGHQVVGVVDAVGKEVRHLREGDRAGVPWLHSTCGQCRFCRMGNENLCDSARFTGLHADGGYAERMIVREGFALRLPQQFSDEQAAPLLCAGIVGYRSFLLSGARSGDRLGLYGFGASAHIVIQIARHLGCEVYVFTRAASHQGHARRLGAAWVGRAEDSPPSPLDASIMFAPAGGLVPPALRVLRKGGTLILAGVTMTPIPEMDYSLLYHERILRSVANATRRDAREFLELAAEIPVETTVHLFTLEQANQALEAMKHSRFEGAGVLRVS